jgi:hypothetical protein
VSGVEGWNCVHSYTQKESFPKGCDPMQFFLKITRVSDEDVACFFTIELFWVRNWFSYGFLRSVVA